MAVFRPHAEFDLRRGPLLRDRLDELLGALPRAPVDAALDAGRACAAAGLERCDFSVPGVAAPDLIALRSSLDEALGRLASLRADDAARAPLAVWLERLAAVAGGVLSGEPGWGAWRERFAGAGISFRHGGDGLVPDSAALRNVALQFHGTAWGQRAFLECLRRGWNRPYGSDAAHEPVIAQAEAWLRDHPDSPIANDVVLELALARETAWSYSVEKAAPSEEDRLAALAAYRRWKPADQRGDLWRRLACFLLERGLATGQRAYDLRGC